MKAREPIRELQKHPEDADVYAPFGALERPVTLVAHNPDGKKVVLLSGDDDV